MPARGSTSRHTRRGRGLGSGRGEFSGRGRKGQKARAGGGMRPGFEGGQLPLIKRLPAKRGFTSPFKKEFQLVNVGTLSAKFQSGDSVSIAEMEAAGLVHHQGKPVKVLGGGELDKPLTVTASHFSAGAQSKIQAAGGKAVKA